MVYVYLFFQIISLMINIKRLFIVTVLFTVFFVSNAISQEVNKVDENGNKTGVWTKKYPNGRLRYKGEFKNGKEVGTFRFYNNTTSSIPHIVKEYSDNGNYSYIKFFNRDGNVKTEGKMIERKREGKWVYYFTNGNVFSEEYYKNGKLDGVLKNYYANKNVTEETAYKNGLKNGVSKIFTESGVLIEEVVYVDGKLNGPAKYFDLKGVIKESGNYKNNNRDGKWEYYIDGEISVKPKRQSHVIDKGE